MKNFLLGVVSMLIISFSFKAQPLKQGEVQYELNGEGIYHLGLNNPELYDSIMVIVKVKCPETYTASK